MKMKLVLVILALAAPSFGGEAKRNKEDRHEAEMKRQAVPRRQDDVEDAVRELVAEEMEKYNGDNNCTAELAKVKTLIRKYNERPVFIVNYGGEADGDSEWAKSDTWNWSPKNAFKNTKYFWHNVKSSSFPQKVWYNYPIPHKVAKIGFTSNKDRETYAPKHFQVIGSNDCSTWTTLHEVQDAAFSSSVAETKYFTIPKANRRKFSCLGLKVLSTNHGSYVCVKNIVMWDDVSL